VSLFAAWITVVDQALCSLTNFATGILVAKATTPEQFGKYSLLMSALLMMSSVQNALVTGPTRILGVRHEHRARFFGAQMLLQLGLIVLLVAGFAFGNVVTESTDREHAGAFILALACTQILELLRVVCLTRFAIGRLLAVDLLSNGTRLVLIFACWNAGWLTPVSAFCIIGIAALTGFGAWPRHLIRRPSTLANIRVVASGNWTFGRWLLVEGLAFNLSTQIYLFLTAIWVETSAVGGLMAVQTLFNAFNIFIIGISNYAAPTARRALIGNDYKSWQRVLFRVASILVVGAIVFGALVTARAEALLSAFYSPTYAEFAFLMPFAAIQAVMQAIASIFLTSFRTALMPEVGAAAHATGAAVTLVASYPLINAFGVLGAAIGLVITPAVWIAVYVCCMMAGMLNRDRLFTPAFEAGKLDRQD
jgi:O-antigen/teichoic acid export membrane protein